MSLNIRVLNIVPLNNTNIPRDNHKCENLLSITHNTNARPSKQVVALGISEHTRLCDVCMCIGLRPCDVSCEILLLSYVNGISRSPTIPPKRDLYRELLFLGWSLVLLECYKLCLVQDLDRLPHDQQAHMD